MFNAHGSRLSLRRIIWWSSLCLFIVLIIPVTRQNFIFCGLRWLYVLLLAFSLSSLLTPPMRLFALKRGIVDIPGGRKIHEQRTPLLGGVAVVTAFTASILSNMILSYEVVALLAGGIVIAVTGVADDWRGIPARLKLMVQVFVVLYLIHAGIILDLFPQTLWGYPLNLLFTMIWIIGITNAMNFIDGMDGLASGVGAIIAMFMSLVAFQTDQPFMGWIGLAMMGSCIGFIPYNFAMRKPAAIYLGDAGSTFIGFMLASLAIMGDWADNSRIVSFSAPVLIFWILIYDMTYITIERILTGKVQNLREWIDYVGTDHIHHRFHRLLGDKKRSVLLIYFLCITLGISALTLRNAGPVEGILLVVQAFFVTIIVSIIEYTSRHRT